MLPLVANFISKGNPGKVAISGESISGSDANPVGIRINTDGTIDSRANGSYTQIDSTTDWIIPNGAANSDYEVRITNVVWTQGSAFTTEAATEDTWIDMSAAREWSVTDTNPSSPGIQDVTFDLEIRYGSSGSAMDSGSYTLLHDYDTS